MGAADRVNLVIEPADSQPADAERVEKQPAATPIPPQQKQIADAWGTVVGHFGLGARLS
ncbi:hypothetical protein [Mesorhizobium sp. WSM3224]|uniref:hypothetical protein n=1 Tax=Mesorhizobium sp. WSM3224 TaxID=1040986 RepID=UPI0012ECA560|nr:hypothetical protein [Mesorhizobium sp. WSM3224]